MSAVETQLTILARRYETGEPVRVTVSAGKVERVEPAWPLGSVDDWPWIAPGLFDLQVNGYGGTSFTGTDVTPERAAAAIRSYLAHGVAQICPTVVTNSFESLACGLAAVHQACLQDPVVAAMVPGCHLEGPYLSGEDGPRGAHPRQHIRPADWSEFLRLQDASGNRICLVTIAPEVEGAVVFIRKAVAANVTIAIGHTGADSSQIAAAVDAGARLSTHLGNGCHIQLPRHPNYLWDQLGESRLAASIITDGHHLPAAVARSIVRAKGIGNTVITCDASGWAGCAPGRYQTSLGDVEVRADGKIVVAGQDRILAGSGATTEVCVAQAAAFGAATLREAIDMACRNPTRLLGFREYRLMAGDAAHLFVYHPPTAESPAFRILSTIVAGRVAWGEIPVPA